MRLTYRDGHGVLRDLLGRFGDHGLSVSDINVERTDGHNGDRAVTVRLEVQGRGSLASLASDLDDHVGVLRVSGADLDDG
jgi:hypothetical protein